MRDAFARSVLWGFSVAAESDGGRRVLVDLTDFLLRDATNIAPRLTPGSYRLDNTRSTIYMPMTMNFPKNTEMEAELTFISQPGARWRRWRVAAGVRSSRASAASRRPVKRRACACTTSFVELPDANYKPRAYDPRSGFGESAGAITPRRSASRRRSGSSRAIGWRR